MKRLADWHLKRWKDREGRKPLIIRGARQVGKTFSVRKLGELFPSFLEVNFEKTKEAAALFEKNLDPVRIVSELKALFKHPVVPGETLLFFDEIQQCPNALTALRYFYEEMPSLHVIAAGSLLDFAIEQVGIPVGRVTSLYVFPLSFIEFLVAMGYSIAAQRVVNATLDDPISETIHELLLELVAQYLAIGGLPEAVFKWVQTKDPLECQKVHHTIADTYRQDFDKYGKRQQIPYLDTLFSQIPHLLGKQFKYSQVHGEFKKRELAPCLDLLCKANVVHRVHHSAGNGIPLGAEIHLDWFKTIFLDVALSQSIMGLDLATWLLQPAQAFVNQGSSIEAFVGGELLCYAQPSIKPNLYFWKREKKGAQAEIDYLHTRERMVIPLEVKSGDGNTLKSMHSFLKDHPNSPYGIRFSTHPFSRFEKVETRPLYSVSSLAHEEQLLSLQELVQEL